MVTRAAAKEAMWEVDLVEVLVVARVAALAVETGVVKVVEMAVAAKAVGVTAVGTAVGMVAARVETPAEVSRAVAAMAGVV